MPDHAVAGGQWQGDAPARVVTREAISPPLIITHTKIGQLFDAVQKKLDRLWD